MPQLARRAAVLLLKIPQIVAAFAYVNRAVGAIADITSLRTSFAFIAVVAADILQNACRHERMQGYFLLRGAVQSLNQFFHLHIFQNVRDRACLQRRFMHCRNLRRKG
jgi:DNA-binding transcriptional regulator WhiA